MPALQSLDLTGNLIGPVGVEQMALSLWWLLPYPVPGVTTATITTQHNQHSRRKSTNFMVQGYGACNMVQGGVRRDIE